MSSVVPAGDAALLVRLGQHLAPGVARRVRALDAAVAAAGWPGLRERVPGYTTLLCEYDPLTVDAAALSADLLRLAAEAAGGDRLPVPPGRQLTVPVAYGGELGPDLDEVAAIHGLKPAEVIRRHAGRTYLVYFLGFSPGFAYMGEVDAAIAAPRRASPRTRVPAGSVAMTAAMTGIYPAATPGGWRILGRTPWRVYDPAAADPALFRQGDEVRFQPIDAAEFVRLDRRQAAPPDPAPPPAGRPVLRVVRPGPRTTVQDLGRPGYQALGVPVAGAADRPALIWANRLVGNPDGAAALELTVLGPQLVALADVGLALGGADLGALAGGRPVAPGESFLLRRGEELRFRGPIAGCRAYLALAGGVAAPSVMGSACADLLGRLGPTPLAAGDEIRAGQAVARPREVAGRRLRPGVYVLPPANAVTAAVVPGPQEEWFTEAERLYAGPYRVLVASDRTGIRLEGVPVPPREGELLSEATPLGSIQVPADGQPIVLLSGRQTVGGYAKIGVVTTFDAWRLAQVRPGACTVRFERVDLAEAHRRYQAAAGALADPAGVVSG